MESSFIPRIYTEPTMKLTHTIKFVSDMEKAVAFYRDTLGLPLKFQSPGWTEFATGDITLALHIASDENPPGTTQLGFGVPDLDRVYAESGLKFTAPPTERGEIRIARFLDSEGAECSISGR